MSPFWSVLVVLLAFVIVMRVKNRRKGKKQPAPAYSPRIEGFQICAFLTPQIGAGCLFDHGMQYGKGFRRKMGPALPHDDHCRCTSVPFSHTSTEVFHGALRQVGAVQHTVEGLSQDGAGRVLEKLKQANGQPVPNSPSEYLEALGLSDLTEHERPLVEAFLLERHQFLISRPANAGESQQPAEENKPE